MNHKSCPTVLGSRFFINRFEHSYNFEKCDLSSSRGKNECIKFDISEFKKDLITGFFDFLKYKINNNSCVLLVLETFRIPKITGIEQYKGSEKYNELDLRNYEKKFMNYVYPYRDINQTKIFKCFANNNEPYISKNGTYNPKNTTWTHIPAIINHSNYNCGIFKFNDSDQFLIGTYFSLRGEKPLLESKKLYHDINLKKEEIWMRVWYKDIWKGIIMPDNFDAQQISDECLVWSSFELELNYPNEIKRGELWKLCHNTIMDRYFDPFKDSRRCLLILAREYLDPDECLIGKDYLPLDLFKILLKF